MSRPDPATERRAPASDEACAPPGRTEQELRGVPPADGEPPALDDPTLYLNRELSLLEFQRRVLQQARDTDAPLLERLRFLTICSAILDEFFEVRVAGLHQQVELGVLRAGPDGLQPRQALAEISRRAHELVREQYRVLNRELLPALEQEGIRVLFRATWTPAVRAWVGSYVQREVLPVLTPVGLDPAHPFPMILNKSLNFIVSLEGRDAFGRTGPHAVVQAPRILPRLIRLPEEISGVPFAFVTLSGAIHENLRSLFPGMQITGCHPFRVTRNSNLWVDEEEVDDLLLALKGELGRRNYGSAVRLEVNTRCPRSISRFLLRHFGLEEDDLYVVDGPVNCHRLATLYEAVDRPDLKFPRFVAGVEEAVCAPAPEAFAAVRRRPFLFHHPYQSLQPVVHLLGEAARDPDVLAIKATLYRTESLSPISGALLDAAKNGKEVTAVVELRARFDEAANIETATRLQEAGAKVVYGVVGYKSHAKMILIVRKENGGLRRYVHLGTGNYHIQNTKQYTDIGLLTCDEDLGADVHDVFQQLTGLGEAKALRKLVQSPFALHERILELIRAEAENARQGRPGRIRAKVNALLEPEVIRELYAASQAGVEIDLVVRGICALRPGLPGVSERIRVRSIVGRFLEHSRTYHFHAGGENLVFAASADWMQRNFFKRVEVVFPIEHEEMKRRVLDETIDVYLEDDAQAWVLEPDGSYRRAGNGTCAAQRVLLERHARRAS